MIKIKNLYTLVVTFIKIFVSTVVTLRSDFNPETKSNICVGRSLVYASYLLKFC